MTKLTSISINYFQGRRRQQKSSIAIDDKWIFLVLIASEVYSVVTYLLTYLLTYVLSETQTIATVTATREQKSQKCYWPAYGRSV